MFKVTSKLPSEMDSLNAHNNPSVDRPVAYRVVTATTHRDNIRPIHCPPVLPRTTFISRYFRVHYILVKLVSKIRMHIAKIGIAKKFNVGVHHLENHVFVR